MALSRFLELCRNAIADDTITEAESRAFRMWLDAHPDMAGISPVDRLLPVMRRIYADGDPSAAERRELRELLGDLAGEDPAAGESFGQLARETEGEEE